MIRRRLTSEQRAVCRRFHAEPEPPKRATVVGLALSRPRTLLPLNGLRHPIVANSNGWFIWRGDPIPQEDNNFFSPVHVEHVTDHAPELAPYLALPPGWRVLLAPGHEDVWFDDAILII